MYTEDQYNLLGYLLDIKKAKEDIRVKCEKEVYMRTLTELSPWDHDLTGYFMSLSLGRHLIIQLDTNQTAKRSD